MAINMEKQWVDAGTAGMLEISFDERLLACCLLVACLLLSCHGYFVRRI